MGGSIFISIDWRMQKSSVTKINASTLSQAQQQQHRQETFLQKTGHFEANGSWHLTLLPVAVLRLIYERRLRTMSRNTNKRVLYGFLLMTILRLLHESCWDNPLKETACQGWNAWFASEA